MKDIFCMMFSLSSFISVSLKYIYI